VAEETNGQATSETPRKKFVVLISPNEKLSFLVDETRFIYRRLPPSKRHAILSEHSVRGLYDTTSVIGIQIAIAQYCLRGWEHLLDAEGKPVPFLEEVVEHLPLDVLERVTALSLEASPDELMERFESFLANSIASCAQADSR